MKKLYGNAIVGQSGGPTAAINATLAGVIKGALECDAIKTLYGMRNGIEGMLGERMIDLSARFEGGRDLDALIHTPAAALGSCRKKLPNPDSEKAEDIAFFEKVFEIFRKYDIRYFFYIGGNDSMDTVAKLSEYTKECDYEMRVIGVPKTIDNDLPLTDHTPGFGSAAKYVATTVKEIVRDSSVYAVKSVTIVEIMGRDTGWLTASSAVLRAVGEPAPHLIYLPESEFSIQKFLNDVREVQKQHHAVIVAVSEGVELDTDDDFQSGNVDNFGHKYLAGIGKALEKIVSKELGCKVRSIELNVMQRCASHISSRTDINEAEKIGSAAVVAALNGETGKMMIFTRMEGEKYEVGIDSADILGIANAVRSVPRNYINERGNNVTDECLSYIAPLIIGEPALVFKGGMPKPFSF